MALTRPLLSMDVGIALPFYAAAIKRMSTTNEKHENGPHPGHIPMSSINSYHLLPTIIKQSSWLELDEPEDTGMFQTS